MIAWRNPWAEAREVVVRKVVARRVRKDFMVGVPGGGGVGGDRDGAGCGSKRRAGGAYGLYTRGGKLRCALVIGSPT